MVSRTISSLSRCVSRLFARAFGKLRRTSYHSTESSIPESTESDTPSKSSRESLVEPLVEAFASLPAFKYNSCPLAPDHIRVVRLLPGPGSLRCTLESVSLNSQYNAVSYVWGTDAPSHLIQIGEQQLALRTNIYDFLRYARVHISLELPFWIDTICIDQDNLDERNEQVRRMDKVFSGATTVIAWLGASPTIRKSLLMLNGIPRLDTIEELEGYFGREQYSMYGYTFKWDNFYTLHPLYMLDYWTRVWIVPEVLLAGKLEIMALDVIVPWEKVVTSSSSFAWYASGVVYTIGQSCETEHPYCGGPDIVYGKGHIYSDAQDVLSGQMARLCSETEAVAGPKLRLYDLSKLIISYGLSNCADTRDRIFALLALADNSCGLAADYSLSNYDLFFEVITRVGPIAAPHNYEQYDHGREGRCFLEFVQHVSKVLDIEVEIRRGLPSVQCCNYNARAWKAMAAIKDRMGGFQNHCYICVRNIQGIFEELHLNVLVIHSIGACLRLENSFQSTPGDEVLCQQYLCRNRDTEPWCAVAFDMCQRYDLKITSFLALPILPQILHSALLENSQAINQQWELKLQAWTPAFIKCLLRQAADLPSADELNPLRADRLKLYLQPSSKVIEPGRFEKKLWPCVTFIQLCGNFDCPSVDEEVQGCVHKGHPRIRLLVLADPVLISSNQNEAVSLSRLEDYGESELACELGGDEERITHHIHQFKGLFTHYRKQFGQTWMTRFHAIVLSLSSLEDIWEMIIASRGPRLWPWEYTSNFHVEGTSAA